MLAHFQTGMERAQVGRAARLKVVKRERVAWRARLEAQPARRRIESRDVRAHLRAAAKDARVVIGEREPRGAHSVKLRERDIERRPSRQPEFPLALQLGGQGART